MQPLQRPTAALVSQYIQKFDAKVGTTDKALTELFLAFPKNDQYEHVLLKVAAVNALYSTSIWNIFAVAEHIFDLKIDAALDHRKPELVDEIAQTPLKGGKFRRNYSFATKYCSWHVPDAYPIYDSFVDRLLWEYQRLDRFSAFKRNDMWSDYLKYRQIIEDYRQFYGLTEFSFKQLDKFLWQYGKECFG